MDIFPHTRLLKNLEIYLYCPLKPCRCSNVDGARAAKRFEAASKVGQQTFAPNQRFGQMVASDLH